MRKPTRLSAKVRKLYKKSEVDISPVLDGLLSECDRIQTIQDKLWEQIEGEPLLSEYTNKAGATNMTASAALKELRSWEAVFQGACRSLFKIMRTEISGVADDEDLQEYV